MGVDPLNKRIRSYYEAHSPDASMLRKLMAANPAPTSQQDSSFGVGWFGFPQLKTMGIAVAMALVAVLAFQSADSLGFKWGQLNQRIADEVAMNHSKALQVEYPTRDILALKAMMGKLDFQISAPKAIRQLGLQVLGARYCSIQGRIAAQIKLKSPDGTRYTLYETRLDKSLDHISGDLAARGISIRMWNEQGLFMALAY